MAKASAACSLAFGLLLGEAPSVYALDGNATGGRVEIPQGTEVDTEPFIHGLLLLGPDSIDALGGWVSIEGRAVNYPALKSEA